MNVALIGDYETAKMLIEEFNIPVSFAHIVAIEDFEVDEQFREENKEFMMEYEMVRAEHYKFMKENETKKKIKKMKTENDMLNKIMMLEKGN
jgi:mevalonate kinase